MTLLIDKFSSLLSPSDFSELLREVKENGNARFELANDAADKIVSTCISIESVSHYQTVLVNAIIVEAESSLSDLQLEQEKSSHQTNKTLISLCRALCKIIFMVLSRDLQISSSSVSSYCRPPPPLISSSSSSSSSSSAPSASSSTSSSLQHYKDVEENEDDDTIPLTMLNKACEIFQHHITTIEREVALPLSRTLVQTFLSLISLNNNNDNCKDVSELHAISIPALLYSQSIYEAILPSLNLIDKSEKDIPPPLAVSTVSTDFCGMYRRSIFDEASPSLVEEQLPSIQTHYSEDKLLNENRLEMGALETFPDDALRMYGIWLFSMREGMDSGEDEEKVENLDIALIYLSKPLLKDLKVKDFENLILKHLDTTMTNLTSSYKSDVREDTLPYTQMMDKLAAFVTVLSESNHGAYLTPHLGQCGAGTNLVGQVMNKMLLIQPTSITTIDQLQDDQANKCGFRVLEIFAMVDPFPMGLPLVMDALIDILWGACGELLLLVCETLENIAKSVSTMMTIEMNGHTFDEEKATNVRQVAERIIKVLGEMESKNIGSTALSEWISIIDIKNPSTHSDLVSLYSNSTEDLSDDMEKVGKDLLSKNNQSSSKYIYHTDSDFDTMNVKISAKEEINSASEKRSSQLMRSISDDRAAAKLSIIEGRIASKLRLQEDPDVQNSDRIKSKIRSIQASSTNSQRRADAIAEIENRLMTKSQTSVASYYQRPSMPATAFGNGLSSDLVNAANETNFERDQNPTSVVNGNNFEEQPSLPLLCNLKNSTTTTEESENEPRPSNKDSEWTQHEVDEEYVAFAVEMRDNSPSELNEAVRYNPGSEFEISKSKKTWGIIGISMAVIAGAIAIIVIYTTQKSEDNHDGIPTYSPSSAPTSLQSHILAEQLLYGGNEDLRNTSTAYGKAFEWLSHDNRTISLLVNKSNSEDPSIEQRFCIALFYFQTLGEHWTNCSASTNTTDINCTVLDRDYIEIKQKRWLGDYHECEWAGISCVEIEDTINRTEREKTRVVIGMNLNGLGLQGSIPSEIARLTELRELYLTYNFIKGSIPQEIGSLSKILAIDLRNNHLSHPIPSELYSLKNLVDLTLAYNELSGTIQTELGNLASLRVLHLSNNVFKATIPSEIGNLNKTLRVLNLDSNRFNGSLPTTINLLTKLNTIFLRNNNFSGLLKIPIAKDLRYLPIANNKFSGTLPDSLYNLTKLLVIDAGNNQFTGELKSDIGRLVELRMMIFRHNNMEGTIPEAMKHLQYVNYVQLHKNKFRGEVTKEMCEGMKRIETFYADCRDGLNNDTALVHCPCCTDCCDPTGRCFTRYRR